MRTQRRYLRARYVLQALRKRSGRLLVASVVLAFVFAGLALIQHRFVHSQVYRTTSQELASGAEQIAREIADEDKWNLKEYRNGVGAPGAEPSAWYVVARDGLVVDIEGFIPGIFGRIHGPEDQIFRGLPTAVGETWRLLETEVEGRYVIVGIVSPKDTSVADSKLKDNAKRFGSTLAEAASVKGREIDNDVDYAVISSDGELKAAWGGVPLKTDMSALAAPSHHMRRLVSNGQPYLLYFLPMLDKQHRLVGMIIVPRNMSLEEQALWSQDRFNLSIVAIAGLLAIVTALALLTRELFGQPREVTLEEALKVGESETIEFKSTFQWDVKQGKRNEDRRLDILKSIAGFLNAKGGILLIGVEEDQNGVPRLCGISEDLNEMGGSKDRLQRLLRDLITERIGPQFAPFIDERFEEHDQKLCWIFLLSDHRTGLHGYVGKANPNFIFEKAPKRATWIPSAPGATSKTGGDRLQATRASISAEFSKMCSNRVEHFCCSII